MFDRRVERCAAVGPRAEPLEARTLLAAVDPNLAAWFRADALTAPAGAAVGLWADATGHGFNATQGDPAHRPTFQPGVLNGKAALHFDATSQTQLSFARPVSGGFTVFVVFSSPRGAGDGDAWYGGAGLVDGDVPGVANDFGLSLNSRGQVLAGTGAPDTFLSSGLGFDDARAHVASFVRFNATGKSLPRVLTFTFATPSAGFLIGWPVAAFVVGWLTERGGSTYKLGWGLVANTVGGIVVLYALGIAGIALVAGLSVQAAAVSTWIFIPGDLVKVVVAALVARGVHAAYPGLLGAPRRHQEQPSSSGAPAA